MGQFTKEQTTKWPSSNTISTAACDSDGALIKVKVSTRLSLMWQTAGMNYTLLHAGGNICVWLYSALSGTCSTDTFLKHSRTTMLLCESNRALRQKNSDDYWNVHSGKFWERQPCVYCYIGLGHICFTMTSKATFCYCTVVNKKRGWQQVKTFRNNQKWKHLRN